MTKLFNWSRHLKAWRKRSGETQVQAADAIGVPVATLRDWEQGRRRPNGLSVGALWELTTPTQRKGKR